MCYSIIICHFLASTKSTQREWGYDVKGAWPNGVMWRYVSWGWECVARALCSTVLGWLYSYFWPHILLPCQNMVQKIITTTLQIVCSEIQVCYASCSKCSPGPIASSRDAEKLQRSAKFTFFFELTVWDVLSLSNLLTLHTIYQTWTW